MIQRIQSVYLLLAAVLCMGFGFVTQAWTSPDPILSFIAGIAAGIGIPLIMAIFRYNNRKEQARFSRFGWFMALALCLAWLGYQAFNGQVQALSQNPHLMAGGGMLMGGALLAWLANRAILKDEGLVRSMDRFR